MTLLQFRSQIDTIDDQIVTLLKNRVEIVKKVGELKKETSASSSFIRAGREAGMLRQLIKKAEGVLPPQAIATMWRMVISSSLGIEQDISIYTYRGEDRTCFWLAREYFGTFLPMHQIDDTEKLIGTVSKTPTAVGVLPLIDNSKNPWWLRPPVESNNIYVFARIPFIEDTNVTPVLAIANTCPEPTDDDVSLFSVTTNADIEKLRGIFNNHGMASNILCRSGDNNFLVEVNRFVAIGDEIIAQISQALGEKSIVRLMGAYAVPVKL